MKRHGIQYILLGLTVGALSWTTALAAPENTADNTMSGLVNRPQYRDVYRRLFVVPDWVVTGQGVSAPPETLSVGGRSLQAGWICRPHDCGNNQLVVLIDTALKRDWALLATRPDEKQPFALAYFGNPDATVQEALQAQLKKHNPE